jgi:hypothetical protein
MLLKRLKLSKFLTYTSIVCLIGDPIIDLDHVLETEVSFLGDYPLDDRMTLRMGSDGSERHTPARCKP